MRGRLRHGKELQCLPGPEAGQAGRQRSRELQNDASGKLKCSLSPERALAALKAGFGFLLAAMGVEIGYGEPWWYVRECCGAEETLAGIHGYVEGLYEQGSDWVAGRWLAAVEIAIAEYWRARNA